MIGECEWRYVDVDDYYRTGCGRAFDFNNYGGLQANGFKFCYCCGKRIKEVKAKKETDHAAM